MKKLLFTALAVVAFSSVSMASNVETEEPIVLNKEILLDSNQIVIANNGISNSSEVYKTDDCGAYASVQAETLEEQEGCFTSAEYNAVYLFYYSGCRDAIVTQ